MTDKENIADGMPFTPPPPPAAVSRAGEDLMVFTPSPKSAKPSLLDDGMRAAAATPVSQARRALSENRPSSAVADGAVQPTVLFKADVAEKTRAVPEEDAAAAGHGETSVPAEGGATGASTTAETYRSLPQFVASLSVALTKSNHNLQTCHTALQNVLVHEESMRQAYKIRLKTNRSGRRSETLHQRARVHAIRKDLGEARADAAAAEHRAQTAEDARAAAEARIARLEAQVAENASAAAANAASRDAELEDVRRALADRDAAFAGLTQELAKAQCERQCLLERVDAESGEKARAEAQVEALLAKNAEERATFEAQLAKAAEEKAEAEAELAKERQAAAETAAELEMQLAATAEMEQTRAVQETEAEARTAQLHEELEEIKAVACDQVERNKQLVEQAREMERSEAELRERLRETEQALEAAKTAASREAVVLSQSIEVERKKNIVLSHRVSHLEDIETAFKQASADWEASNASKNAELASLRAEVQAAAVAAPAAAGSANVGRATVSALAATVRGLKDELRQTRRDVARLPQQVEVGRLAGAWQMAMESWAEVNGEAALSHVRADLAEERRRRRALYDRLCELRGNIRVHVRIRPFLRREAAGADASPLVVDSSERVRLTSRTLAVKQFDVDHVHGPESTQADVYEQVEPLVCSALDGFNVCIMAYGQTGSGKTFTMSGSAADPGIVPRTAHSLFQQIDERAARSDVTFTVQVSMLEIYNNDVRDLLTGSMAKVDVVQVSSGLTEVRGVETATCETPEDLVARIEAGAAFRTEASTQMNDRSSRSHSVVMISLAGRDDVLGTTSRAKITLVDLAGSESVDRSGAVGETLRQAKHINKSLSALGDVMAALTQRGKGTRVHVPYRNSRLTTLLRDHLGGTAKMLMLVTVSPAPDSLTETQHALMFGVRARQTERGAAQQQLARAEDEREAKRPRA